MYIHICISFSLHIHWGWTTLLNDPPLTCCMCRSPVCAPSHRGCSLTCSLRYINLVERCRIFGGPRWCQPAGSLRVGLQAGWPYGPPLAAVAVDSAPGPLSLVFRCLNRTTSRVPPPNTTNTKTYIDECTYKYVYSGA